MENIKKSEKLRVRGFLLHLTHYDPKWVLKKKKEKPFDLEVALEIVDELARQHFNTLLVGVSDGVKFQSHPEFAKPYSVPMEQLKALCAHAISKGLDIVPKLNFSRSEINCHNHWMRAPDEEWHTHFDDDYYWKTAFEVMDEVSAACQPRRYFHVGMDEDHQRSYTQYVEALNILHAGLKKRKLRMAAWSDSALDYPSGDIYREKTLLAETKIPKDSVRLLWNYWAVPAAVMKEIARQEFELWGAPGAKDEGQVKNFKKALLEAGGTGMVMTRWIACRKKNRNELLGLIKHLGPLYT